jgi:hypothetical protein
MYKALLGFRASSVWQLKPRVIPTLLFVLAALPYVTGFYLSN